ncbi:MAG: putative AB-hydrolase YheT, partial [Thermoleophilia bacterium]|nr:putative AB-hydrolase YheT [Thermoleophilia bacterium]
MSKQPDRSNSRRSRLRDRLAIVVDDGVVEGTVLPPRAHGDTAEPAAEHPPLVVETSDADPAQSHDAPGEAFEPGGPRPVEDAERRHEQVRPTEDDAEAPAAATRTARRRARLAPHAARHATRARRTWIALAFFPFFAIYVVIDALRDLRDVVARDRNDVLQSRPRFVRPEAMGPLEDRSMEAVVTALEQFPFNPTRLSATHAFYRDNGPDAIGALLSPNPQMTTIPHFYPRPFEQRLFTGDQGQQLAGMEAMHEHAGPAVVICHGLLMTKNFDAIIQLARRAFEQWGFHVVTVDLRGWGQSAWTSAAPASAGFHEGRDIIEIARELKRNPLVTSVGAIGFSLGGASVLNASHVSSIADDTPLDGGAVTISAPTQIAMALEHISTKPHWRDPYFGLWNVFRAAIKGNVRRKGLRRDLGTWYDLVEELSAPYYGISMEEFCARASAVNFAAEITTPVLDLHAADDFLVPVQHAYALQEAATGNEWIHVMVRDCGAHCSFAAVDS